MCLSRKIVTYFISKYILNTYTLQGPEGLVEYKGGICSKGSYEARPENQDLIRSGGSEVVQENRKVSSRFRKSEGQSRLVMPALSIGICWPALPREWSVVSSAKRFPTSSMSSVRCWELGRWGRGSVCVSKQKPI